MPQLKLLQRAANLNDIAHILKFSPSTLSYILYKKPKGQLYSQFYIQKKSGGVRTISAPCPELKELQRRLSLLLQNCISEINKNRNITKSLAHGFKRGYSIVTNASKHKKKQYVFNIDLEDFFGQINFGRVRGFFIKNENFLLSEKAATVVAQIICFDNSLPQGSPCSPVMSNLIGHILDIRLSELAYRMGCTYSRYADDITFSSNKRVFPERIAKQLNGTHEWKAGSALVKIVEKSQFKINYKKVRMQYKDSRQSVTGLTVNAKVNIHSKYRRTARAMADRLFKTGSFEIGEITNEGPEKPPTKGTINQLLGAFSFIHMVNNQQGTAPKELNSIEKVHRKLIFYNSFYASDIPTIICEGKTDNIYIQCAILSLADKFPHLAEKDGSGVYKLKIRLIKFSRQLTHLFEWSGGTGDFPKFIGGYTKECATFASPRTANPVIILIDNDKGASTVYSAIKSASNLKFPPDKTKEFHYVAQNLYVVATPITTPLSESKIEDFFDKETLDTKLNGKVFNSSNTTTSADEYGKHIFSEYVIKANRKTIDFSGFTPLLTTISKIIETSKA